jgi:GT2 family glycosyltransferase
MLILNISIVLYNNKPDEIVNIIKILKQINFKHQIYIIDNSPNRVFKLSETNFIYLHLPSNPGFGAAHNIAMQKTIDSKAKYHLVLNPDVYFEPKIISELVKFMDDNPTVGNVMPKVFFPDGTLQYLCKLLPTPYDWIGRRFNPFRFMVEKRNQLFELRFTNYDKQMDVPYLSGCFMFLRAEALVKIGIFDEKIFMYGEETDLCRRLNRGGYRTVFNPNVSIIHEFQKGSHKSWRLTKIGIQSAIYYFNKWGWIWDTERKNINKKTLAELEYLK